MGITDIPLASDVLFETASSDLSPAASLTLRSLHTAIQRQAGGARILVIGHTDSRGSDLGNQVLSLERARAVVAWFEAAGYPPELLAAEGRGETELLEPDHDSRGRFLPAPGARNRRVVIRVDAS